MVDTVAAAQGADVLLEDLGDPFAFLRRFQAVRPTCSASSLAYLDALEADLRRRAPARDLSPPEPDISTFVESVSSAAIGSSERRTHGTRLARLARRPPAALR
jgi:hypothetical protein